MPNPFEIFGEGLLWAVLGVLWGGFAYCFHEAVASAGSRGEIKALMEARDWPQRYRRALEPNMNRLDRYLAPRASALQKTALRHAFTGELFALCLGLAAIYPILCIFGVWAITGEPGMLGSYTAIPGEEDISLRAEKIGGLVISLGLAAMARMALTAGERKKAVFLLGASLFVAANAVSVFAFALAFWGAVAFAVAGTFSVAFAAAGVFPSSGAIAFALASVIAYGALWLRGYTGRIGRILVVMTIALLAALFCILKMRDGIDSYSMSVIVFLGFLPALNAVFDFLSLGWTRFCLRHGLGPAPAPAPGGPVHSPGTAEQERRELRGRALRWSLIDFVGALALFFLLGVTCCLLFSIVTLGSGDPLLDPVAFLASVRTAPEDYWWLYLTFFSTLLPTLLHMGIAFFSLFTLCPDFLKSWINVWLDGAENNGFKRVAATFTLTTLATLSIAAPLILIYGLIYGVWYWKHGIGWWFLGVFEGIAAWLA